MNREFCIGAAILVTLCTSALAQTQLSKSTKTAHDVFLEGYVRTDKNCESIDPPPIYLDQPPQHGIVCLRSADVYIRKVEQGNLTHCVRRKTLGVHVIYLPRAGYVGPDTVRYTVEFPGVRHAVQVNLTVLPDDDPRRAVPADISAPAGESRNR